MSANSRQILTLNQDVAAIDGSEIIAVENSAALLACCREENPAMAVVGEKTHDLEELLTSMRATLVPVLLAIETEKNLSPQIENLINDYYTTNTPEASVKRRINNILNMVEDSTELRRTRSILESFFSKDFIKQVMQGEIAPKLGGQKTEATVMFFDLRNSMMISQQLDPWQLSEFLSELFTDIMDIVYANNGSVNRMLGDGMLIMFGIPAPDDNMVRNAAQCAIDIRDHFRTYNEVRPDYLTEPISAGMGIATGNMFAGNIGSVHRIEYTVLGDTVNIAARLESYNKLANTEILIDDNTWQKISSDGEARQVEIEAARGRMKNVPIYELISLN